MDTSPTRLLLFVVGFLASGEAPATLVPAATEYLTHERWTVRDGLVQQTVTDVLEARSGYLWLTTYGGLARFDGVRFRTFELDDNPELGNNKLVSLFEDDQGQIWIGTVGGGVVRMDETGFTYFSEGTPGGDVQDFAQDANGTLWVAGIGISRRVVSAGDIAFEPVSPPGWDPDTRVGDLLITGADTLWAVTDQGLLRYADGDFDWIDEGELARGARAMVTDTEGTLWLVSRHGIGYVNGNEVVQVAELDDVTVFDAILDSGGKLLAGLDDGLRRLEINAADDATLLPIVLQNDDESLQSGVTALHLDRSGNIWAGTNNFGLVRLTRAPFSQFEDMRGLQHGSVLQLASDHRGGMWIQGQTGWILHGANGAFRTPDETAGWNVPGQAQLLGATQDGAWLRGESLLYRVDGSFDTGFETNTFKQTVGQGMVEDWAGTIWFGGEGRLVSFADGDFRSHELPGIEHAVQPHLQSSDGFIWFSSRGLVGRRMATIEPVGYELIGNGNQWLRAELRAMHEAPSGTIWLTTYGNGLVRIRDGRLSRFARAQGLSEVSLGGILEDSEGRLWVNSNQGVLVLELRSLDAVETDGQPTILPRFLGSAETNGPAAAKDLQGRMWFATVRGLVVAEPDRFFRDPRPPIVHIEDILADGSRIDSPTKVVIPAGTQDLSVKYTGLALSQPRQVRFRYRLENYQDEWVDAGTRRRAYFTKIPPGDYRFQVMAANADGVWSEPEGLRFSALARIYQTLWFQLLAAIAIMMFFVLMHRHRVARIKENARTLQNEINSRRKAERERAVLQSSVMKSTRLEAIGRLAGGVAHDFNNVITAILGNAEQLQVKLDTCVRTGSEAPADTLTYVDSIAECSKRAASLTRQLLAFSGQQVLKPRIVSVNSVIDGLQPLLEQLLPENIELHWHQQSDLPSIRVDPSQLEQVVMNLVLNARDAMPDGGRITISSRRSTIDEPDARLSNDLRSGEQIEIEVADTGTGIEPEVIPHIFDPFYTTKGQGHGTGLGLASVHGIVVQSGGQIKVTSVLAAGTTFRVTFPAVTEVEKELKKVPSPDDRVAVQRGSQRVLVCEDNDAIRETLSSTLSARGYEAFMAADPDEAIRLVENKPTIDMLITDVILPGMNGRDLATRIRQICPDVSVLYISGYASNVLNADYVDEASSAFLQKPFTPSELLAKIHEMLKRDKALEHLSTADRSSKVPGALHETAAKTPNQTGKPAAGIQPWSPSWKGAERRLRPHLLAVWRRLARAEVGAILAHELKQPLTAISLHSETALAAADASQDADPALVEDLCEIASQACRAGEIVNDLQGVFLEHETHWTIADINPVVMEASRILQPEALQQNVTINLHLERHLPPVRLDRALLLLALIGLIRIGLNSNQRVTGVPHRVNVLTSLRGENVEVMVESPGPELDAEELHFGPGSAADAVDAGLELAICRRIIAAHNSCLRDIAGCAQCTCRSFSLPVAAKTRERAMREPVSIESGTQ